MVATNIFDEEWADRRSDTRTEYSINNIRSLIENNQRIRVHEIFNYVRDIAFDTIFIGTINKIIRDDLHLRKLSARYVPQILTDKHKLKCAAAAIDFLSYYNEGGEDFLTRIVTGDEKWVHYYTLETKEASRQWTEKGERQPKKANMERSTGKVMLAAFWDSREHDPGGIFTERGHNNHTDLLRYAYAAPRRDKEKTPWQIIKRHRPAARQNASAFFASHAEFVTRLWMENFLPSTIFTGRIFTYFPISTCICVEKNFWATRRWNQWSTRTSQNWTNRSTALV